MLIYAPFFHVFLHKLNNVRSYAKLCIRVLRCHAQAWNGESDALSMLELLQKALEAGL